LVYLREATEKCGELEDIQSLDWETWVLDRHLAAHWIGGGGTSGFPFG
jgi:hypothetical protein